MYKKFISIFFLTICLASSFLASGCSDCGKECHECSKANAAKCDANASEENSELDTVSSTATLQKLRVSADAENDKN